MADPQQYIKFMSDIIDSGTWAALSSGAKTLYPVLLKFSDQSDTEILIAVSNELFVMEFANEGTPEYPNGRINITPVSLPYTSGSGGAYALGALLALDRVKHDLTRAKDRVKIALEIAGEVSASCNRLIDFEVE